VANDEVVTLVVIVIGSAHLSMSSITMRLMSLGRSFTSDDIMIVAEAVTLIVFDGFELDGIEKGNGNKDVVKT